MADERADNRPRGPQYGAGDPNRLAARCGWQQHGAAALGPATHPQACGDGQRPGAADPAQQQWLGQLDPAQAPMLDAGVARGDEAATHVQAAALVPGQPEVPEGQHVAERGRQGDQQRHHDQDPGRDPDERCRGHVVTGMAQRTEAGEVHVGVADDPYREAEDGQRGHRPGQVERGVAHPARIEAGQLLLGHDRARLRRFDRLMQQFGAQPLGLLGRNPVQRQPVGAAAVRGAGADRHLRQPKHPMQQVGRDIDGADAVQPGVDALAPQQAPAQLNLFGVDAITGREPAADRQADNDDRHRETPVLTGPVVGAGQQDADQNRKCLAELDDRMDQQHAGAQPAPAIRVDHRPHVASSSLAWVRWVRVATS